MFISQTHLRHLLEPDQYCDPQQHQREQERLFLPAWHFVCTTADLPRSGDFATFDLLDHPLLIKNFDGRIETFLNVCAHRHCRLTDEQRGHSPTLKCQYHGWEFDRSGETRKIPDARSFRPFKKGQVGLLKFRTETAGQLVFVTLAENGPSLREYLGPLYDETAAMFNEEWEQVWTWEPVCEGNWKIAYEITLEGYHVQCAHAETLGKFPPARDEDCRHELLTRRHSSFRADRSKDRFAALNFERFAVRACGGDPKCEYTHLHTYPNFGCITQNVFAIAQSVLPRTAATHQNLYRLFVYRGKRGGIVPGVLKSVLRFALRSLWSRTFAEDAAIVEQTQQGMGAPRQASGGLISIREERVFHFQEFVRDATRSQSLQDAGLQRPRSRRIRASGGDNK